MTTDISDGARPMMFEWYVGLAREMEIRHEIENAAWMRDERPIDSIYSLLKAT